HCRFDFDFDFDLDIGRLVRRLVLGHDRLLSAAPVRTSSHRALSFGAVRRFRDRVSGPTPRGNPCVTHEPAAPPIVWDREGERGLQKREAPHRGGASGGSSGYWSGWTIQTPFPFGSRTWNIGGIGGGARMISSSTSTPASFSALWSASTSVESMMMPVRIGSAFQSGGGDEIASAVDEPGGTSSTHFILPSP